MYVYIRVSVIVVLFLNVPTYVRAYVPTLHLTKYALHLHTHTHTHFEYAVIYLCKYVCICMYL